MRTFDAASIRNDFPILPRRVHGRRLIWLDNGATTQKPQAVIDRLAYFYAHENPTSIAPRIRSLRARPTPMRRRAKRCARFSAPDRRNEIVFVRGATEGINLVAQSWGRRNVEAGDEIVVTWLEHHANIVPWQQLCAETGAKLRVAPVDDSGDVMLDEYEKLLGPRTRIVALTQVSNALGTVTPVREMIAIAHRHGALVLVDGAQSVSHMRADVQALDCRLLRACPATRCSRRPASACVYGKQAISRRDAALAGRRQHDRRRDLRADNLSDRARRGSRPAPATSPTPSGSARRSTISTRSAWRAIARHEHELIARRVAGLCAIPGLR